MKKFTDLSQRTLKDSIAILSRLQHWTSSRHCARALDMLLARLQSQSVQRHAELYARRIPPSRDSAGVCHDDESHDPYRNTLGNVHSYKRQRLDKEAAGQNSASRLDNNLVLDTQMNLVDPPIVQPVLEYIGPDFGFDANISSTEAWQQGVSDQEFSLGFAGLFDPADWDAYMSTLDNTLSL